MRPWVTVGTLWVALAASPLAAERLPVRVFAAADGLAGNAVQSLVEDPRGFLWIGTSTGISRFDGFGFTNYGIEDGLPRPGANALLVDSAGTLWVATSEGLAWLREPPAPGQPLFASLHLGTATTDRVLALAEGKDGRLWAGSATGLFVVERQADTHHARPVPLGIAGEQAVHALLPRADGGLWVGTSRGLAEVLASGQVLRHRIWPDAHGDDPVRGLALDPEGGLWISHQLGVLAASPPPAAGVRSWRERAGPSWRRPGVGQGVRVFELASLVAGAYCSGGIALGRDGDAWFSTSAGLLRVGEARARLYTEEHGLPETKIDRLLEDRAGNLWFGTESRGLARLSSSGFVSFGPADGLELQRLSTVFEAGSGELMVFANDGISPPRLYLQGESEAAERFVEVTPPALRQLAAPGWGWSQTAWQDSRGEWWFASGEGLLRFPPASPGELGRAGPPRRYGRKEGLPGVDVFRFFEDRRGDLWISLLDTVDCVVRWRRAEDRLEIRPRLPNEILSAPTAYAEDGAGNLWMGFYLGGLARWNEAEGLRPFPAGVEVPSGFVSDLHLDSKGRLWAAMSNGAVRVDDPAGPAPRFSRYAPPGSLARDSVRSIAEDGAGRLYLASDRGIDRFEPESGGLESFTTGDGLANSNVRQLFADRRGQLWVATVLGLSRLAPQPPRSPPPVPVVVSAVEVAGVSRALPAVPVARLAGFELPPGGNILQVGFTAVSLAPGASARYQTRLLDLAPEWSSPSANRSVLLAGLPAGRHRLQVRAVSAAGAGSEVAEVAFTVLPPFWRRGWFLATAGLALALAVWGAYRYRVGRLLAVERVRTRIASDLHDEVGASLSRIGILAEVGKMRLGAASEGEAGRLLAEISDTSRGLAEAMSDIVWSLDPRRDDLPSLSARLRRFASDVLEARGIGLDFETPAAAAGQRLSTADRRELYLLLKEAIHNAAKHSRAARVTVRIVAHGSRLEAEVRDDGLGLPEVFRSSDNLGNGLVNMRRRAKALGGALTVDSTPGRGTSVRLAAPLSSWRRWRRFRSA